MSWPGSVTVTIQKSSSSFGRWCRSRPALSQACHRRSPRPGPRRRSPGSSRGRWSRRPWVGDVVERRNLDNPLLTTDACQRGHEHGGKEAAAGADSLKVVRHSDSPRSRIACNRTPPTVRTAACHEREVPRDQLVVFPPGALRGPLSMHSVIGAQMLPSPGTARLQGLSPAEGLQDRPTPAHAELAAQWRPHYTSGLVARARRTSGSAGVVR